LLGLFFHVKNVVLHHRVGGYVTDYKRLLQMSACVATNVCMCCNKCVHVLQHMCACVATNVCMCCNKCVHVLQQMCACVATNVRMCCNKCVHVLQKMCACVATNVRMCCNKCVHLLLHLHVILPLERLGFKIELQCVSQCALQCVRFIRVGGLGAMF